MKTIEKVFKEFLKEQKSRLKPKTYKGYEDAIFLFTDCLNGYAYQNLGKEDSERFDNLYNEKGKEYCKIFNPDKIGSTEINEFLNYFMIRKVMGGKELSKTVSRVMKKLVTWMNEKGYMKTEVSEYSIEVADRAKDELPQCEELYNLIWESCEYREYEEYSEKVDGYLRVIKIAPGKLWLEDHLESGRQIGPVIVDHDISSLCQVGWVINLMVGKTRSGWKMLESGNVYPN